MYLCICVGNSFASQRPKLMCKLIQLARKHLNEKEKGTL